MVTIKRTNVTAITGMLLGLLLVLAQPLAPGNTDTRSVIVQGSDLAAVKAAVQAARFVFDDRDEGLEERLPVLDTPDGVWACDNHLNCTRVCPRGIKVTKAINLTKRLIKQKKESSDQDV